MTKDNTSKSIDVGETLHRQLELLFATLNRFEESGALQHLARDLNRHQDLMRTFSGPIEELRRSGLRNLESSIGDNIRRLYPIRICTMHARLITSDDELFLYVETKRLLAAIGATS